MKQEYQRLVDGTDEIDKQVIPLDIVKDVVMEIKEEYKDLEQQLPPEEELKETLKLDEIQVHIPDAEMSNPGEDFSMSNFTRELIFQISNDIISRIEERKDLMASLEQKRKKWIMWGKGTEEKKK